MDQKKAHALVWIRLVLGLCLGGGVLFLWLKVSQGSSFGSVADKLHIPNPLSIFSSAYESFRQKAMRLAQADDDNRHLRQENAQLKLDLEVARFDCRTTEGQKSTERYALQMTKDAGSRVGRTLDSIAYKPPTHLLPGQLYVLAMAYLKSHEDEKAAVILTALTSLEENELYKTPENNLIAGLLWYRLENFTMADGFFDEVLKFPESQRVNELHAQSRLWKALIAKKMNHDGKAQEWLKELIDHHPGAMETSWVNGESKKSESHE